MTTVAKKATDRKWFGWHGNVQEPLGDGANFLYQLGQNGLNWLGKYKPNLIIFAKNGRLGKPIGSVCFDWVMSQPKFVGEFKSHKVSADGKTVLPALADASDFSGGATAKDALESWGVDLDAVWVAVPPAEVKPTPPIAVIPKPSPTLPHQNMPPHDYLLYQEYPQQDGSLIRIIGEPGPQYPKDTRNLGVEKWNEKLQRWDPVAGHTFDTVADAEGTPTKTGTELFNEFVISVQDPVGAIDPARLWVAAQALVSVHIGSPSGVYVEKPAMIPVPPFVPPPEPPPPVPFPTPPPDPDGAFLISHQYERGDGWFRVIAKRGDQYPDRTFILGIEKWDTENGRWLAVSSYVFDTRGDEVVDGEHAGIREYNDFVKAVTSDAGGIVGHDFDFDRLWVFACAITGQRLGSPSGV